MNARTLMHIPSATLAAMLLISGCGGGNGDSAPSGGSAAVELPDVEIPTTEEAEAAAAAEITSENADEAFEELSREIEADLDADG